MESNIPPGNTPPPYSPPPPPPPVSAPPPLIAPAFPPRPPRRGTGWKVFAIILLVLLAFSLLFNFVHAVGSAVGSRGRAYHTTGPRLEEVTLKESDSANKVAVVNIEGVISGEPLDQGGFSMVSVVK